MQIPDRPKGAMDPVQAWLAEMPRDGIRKRITELQQEIAKLRMLEQLAGQEHPVTPPAARAVSSVPTETTQGIVASSSARVRRQQRLSPERAEIIRLIRERPNGMSPLEIAQALGKDPNPVQTTMSRMARAGQVTRVGQGLYRLPPHIPASDLLTGPEDNEEVDES